jgi:hypothetical protein
MRIEWRFILAITALGLILLWALLSSRRRSLMDSWRARSDNPLSARDYAFLRRAGHGALETTADRRFTQWGLLLFALMPFVFSIVMILTLGVVAEQAGLSRAQAWALTKNMDRALSVAEARAVHHVQLTIAAASLVPFWIVMLTAIDAVDSRRRLCALVLVRLEQLGDPDLRTHPDAESPRKTE